MIVKPRSGSGSRGIRLIERARRARGARARRHAARPGAPARRRVLARRARPRRRARRRVVPRERLKVDSGIAVTGRTLHDEALERFAREVARLIGLTTRRQRPGQGRRRRRARAAGGQRPLPGHDAADRSPPASTCRGWPSARRSGTPIPDGPLPFEDIAMVRYFQERFFALRRHRRPAAPRGGDRRVNPRADMHVHSTFSDGKGTIEDNIAAAEALGLTALGCVDHVRVSHRLGARVRRGGRAAARRDRRSSCAAGSRPSCSTRPARSTCPDGIEGVDAIYAADHQVPLADGPTHPREVRERIEAGDLDAAGGDRRDPDRRRRARSTARSGS